MNSDGGLVYGVNYFPLRNTSALDVWQRLREPYLEDWNNTCYWVSQLAWEYWKSPSAPFEGDVLSNRPNYEVREADLRLIGIDAWVLYSYDHQDYWVDLILVV